MNKTQVMYMGNWIKKNGVTLLLVAVMLVGAGFISYPTFSDWWNSFHQSRAVASYVETVNQMDPAETERLLREAEEYNRSLAENQNQWTLTEAQKEAYPRLLSMNGSDIMGYITIDRIGIKLPIHHTTDESVLQVAVGHLEESSLPVGGPGTHCVVSGHRGLPSARLFTDIDKLVEGDRFTLSVFGRNMTYEVNQIVTVLPTEVQELLIVPGKDYCTLVTCTPYGINTHRLLIRGERVEDVPVTEEEEVNTETEAAPEPSGWQLPVPVFVAAPIATVGLLLLIFIIRALMSLSGRKRSGKNDKEHRQEDIR